VVHGLHHPTAGKSARDGWKLLAETSRPLVADLDPGLDIANASLADGGDGGGRSHGIWAERAFKSRQNRFFVDHHCHRRHRRDPAPAARPSRLGGHCLVTRSPSSKASARVRRYLFSVSRHLGHVHDIHRCLIADAAMRKKAIAVVAQNSAVAGAASNHRVKWVRHRHRLDASASAFGRYGGPHAVLHGSERRPTSARCRALLVGVTVDTRGNQALRLALQTREQHIRREKGDDVEHLAPRRCGSPSIASMYAVFPGPVGLKGHCGGGHIKAATALAPGPQAARFHHPIRRSS